MLGFKPPNIASIFTPINITIIALNEVCFLYINYPIYLKIIVIFSYFTQVKKETINT